MATLTSKVSMMCEKNGRQYELLIPQGAPCGELYDACFEFLNDTIKLSQEMAKNAEQKKQEEEEQKENN